MKKYYIVSLSVVLIFVAVFALAGAAITFLYPVKFKNEIKAASEEFNVPTDLIASVINVESGYRVHTISNAGAIGLMQLMPDTAYEISKKLNDTTFSIDKLYDPMTNIRYGTYYLSYLKDVNAEDFVGMLASYNAGLGKVNSWLKDKDYSENGMLLSTPYEETNNFILRVKKNQKIYRHIFK